MMKKVFDIWLKTNQSIFSVNQIVIDEIKSVEGTLNPSSTVYHSSISCLGQISVWDDGQMYVEIVEIESGKSIYREHFKINENTDFKKLLGDYIQKMGTKP